MNTPNDIEVLIHCHCSPNVHPRADAPAVIETIERFLNDEIIERSLRNEGTYNTTDKGRAWLKCILNVPYPTQRWVDSNGNAINTNQTGG